MNLDVDFVLLKAFSLSALTAGVYMSNLDYFCIAYKFKVQFEKVIFGKKK